MIINWLQNQSKTKNQEVKIIYIYNPKKNREKEEKFACTSKKEKGFNKNDVS